MDGLVFYCADCRQSFAGEEYKVSDRPCCPKCNKKTLSTGITKALWVQKTKEERQEILEALIKEDEQREQNIAKREEYARTVGVTYKEKDKDTTNSYLDGMYIDIGKKIKGWAKWIFIVGAFASVIGAVGMLFAAEDGWVIITALLTLVLGPMLAWVSSWILYAFGELVEKTSANEQNTRNILKLMLENNTQRDKD
jgi:hypothetical protein